MVERALGAQQARRPAAAASSPARRPLRRRLARASRILRTGISFAAFGVGGLLLAATALPLARLAGGTGRERDLRCQRIVHATFRWFARFMEGLGIHSLRVEGAEALRAPGRIVVANHPTLLDVVMLVAQMPQADCVVKRAAWSNPFMRGVVRAAGYVPNDLGEALVEECAARLADGRTLLFFPEGTRSPAGRLGPFRRGAAHVALRTGRPLLPVFVQCEPPSLGRGQKWYDVPERRMQFTVRVGEAIDPPAGAGSSAADGAGRARGAASRRLSRQLLDFFERERARAAGASA